MDNCIFCKIVKGEIPCQKIAENEDFLAFLDNQPFTMGHTLVVSKKHFRWTYDVPNFGQYWEFTKKISQTIQNKFNPEFVNFLTMGNEVPHAHIHLIPRYKDDCLTGLYKEEFRTHPSSKQLQQIADNINS